MPDQIEYYTASAAQSVLGVDYNALRRYVANGDIRVHQLAGKKHRVYLKEDVDALARRLRKDTEKIRIIDKEELTDDHYPGRISHDRERGSPLFAGG